MEDLYRLLEIKPNYLFHCKTTTPSSLYLNCYGKEKLVEGKTLHPDLKVYLVHKSLPDFTTPNNFLNFLIIYQKHYGLYNNSFNGKKSFQENFLDYFLFNAPRMTHHKKFQELLKELKNFKWEYDKSTKYSKLKDK